jgi:hypothetical protein
MALLVFFAISVRLVYVHRYTYVNSNGIGSLDLSNWPR